MDIRDDFKRALKAWIKQDGGSPDFPAMPLRRLALEGAGVREVFAEIHALRRAPEAAGAEGGRRWDDLYDAVAEIFLEARLKLQRLALDEEKRRLHLFLQNRPELSQADFQALAASSLCGPGLKADER